MIVITGTTSQLGASGTRGIARQPARREYPGGEREGWAPGQRIHVRFMHPAQFLQFFIPLLSPPKLHPV